LSYVSWSALNFTVLKLKGGTQLSQGTWG